MKKIFIAVLAVAALASCATDEIVSTPKGAAIGFDEAFVDNSTRANDLNKANLEGFNVYGTVTKATTGIIFDGTLVSKSVTNGELSSSYKYEGTQYWIPSAAYYFVALAPATPDAEWSYDYGTDDNAYSGEITFNNGEGDANANQDLIFASATRSTGDTIDANIAAVSFTFEHILSRIKFTFTNGFDASNNITLKVTDVILNGLYPTGKVAVADGQVGTWSVEGATFNKAFGDAVYSTDNIMGANNSATTEHFYVIPTNVTYTVTFKVTLYQAGVEIDTYNRQAEVAIDAQKGYSYEVKATLTAKNVSDEDAALEPIEFDVNEVNGWENFTEVTVPEDGVEKIPAQGNN